ncbi:MAG: tetratricopeptide repeat protein [Candidatus Peribacteraceae bacterium]|nr:tetratricopeptide repeat protein [Candidatus Peribacteraceae bacterium]
MKLPARIAVPVLLALTLSVVIGGFLLWQIKSSIKIIETSFLGGRSTPSFLQGIIGKPARATDSILNQSQALTALRDGEIFELKGEWKRAEEKYAASVAAGGGAPALRKLIAVQLQRREYDAAEMSIGKLREERGNSPDVAFLEGLLALDTGDVQHAKSIFERNREDPRNLFGIAMADIVLGDHEGAKAILLQTSQSGDPDVRLSATVMLGAYNEFTLFPEGQDIHLRTLLARSLAQVRACEPALMMLSGVVHSAPRYRDAWIVKGYCEFVGERLKESLASLEQAYALDAQKPEIQYFLARTHAALGDPQNAVTFLRYAIVNGFSPIRDARQLLAQYALELGNTDLALEQFRLLAEQEDGDVGDVAAYVNLAVQSDSHAVDALEIAKQALKRWPDDPRALAAAGKAALAAGLPDDASRYLETALRIDPRNAEALKVQREMKKQSAETR